MATTTPLPRNYFAGTEFKDSISNEKRALLALIAERGTEGAAAYAASKATSDAARASSSEKAAARGAAVNAPSTLLQGINDDYDSVNNAYRDAMAYEQLSHGREMDRIALANSSYKDALVASQPGLEAAMASQIEALRLRAAAMGGGGGGGGGGGSSARGLTVPIEAIHAESEAASQNPVTNPWLYPDAASVGLTPTIGSDGQATGTKSFTDGGGARRWWDKNLPKPSKPYPAKPKGYVNPADRPKPKPRSIWSDPYPT
jgi:hypothetical protein